jgi:HSP20 family protein
MAEPQTTNQTEQSRARESGAQNAAQKEPRSFETRGAAAQQAGELVRAAHEGSRQLAEAGAEAGRSLADGWRRSFDPYLALQFDMNRWFDDLWRQAIGFDGMPALRMLYPFGRLAHMGGFFSPPPADVKETKDAYLLSLELPGLTRGDVDITLTGDTLAVRGQKIEENEDASSAYRVSERRFGRFERSFPIPVDVERKKIEAQFRDGVLKIAMPKRPEAAEQRSKIEIKA